MKRFMYTCFVAFWSSIVTMSVSATLSPSASGNGAPDGERSISTEELARHTTPDDCWMAIDGVVYDFSDYIPQHPAPPVVMTSWCGKEASEAYHTKGYGRDHSPAADAMLPAYRVGILAGPGAD